MEIMHLKAMATLNILVSYHHYSVQCKCLQDFIPTLWLLLANIFIYDFKK